MLRLIYSGLFDKFPRLQMIIRHLRELLPYTAYRTDRYYGLGGDNVKRIEAAVGLPAAQFSHHHQRELRPEGLCLRWM